MIVLPRALALIEYLLPNLFVTVLTDRCELCFDNNKSLISTPIYLHVSNVLIKKNLLDINVQFQCPIKDLRHDRCMLGDMNTEQLTNIIFNC